MKNNMGNIPYLKEHENELLQRLSYIRNYINYDFLFSQYYSSAKIIKRYYKLVRFPFFRVFCSCQGFMHIGLSTDGKYKKNRLYEYTHLKMIAYYLKNYKTGNILEIGCGQGINLQYLSKQYPKLNFIGVDLIPGPIINMRRPLNISYIKDDYHKLSYIPNQSIDLIFAIETICYSTDKEKVFRELRNKLKPSGIVIIFDAYSCRKRDTYSQIERLSLDVVENAYHISSFEYVCDVENSIRKTGFSIVFDKKLDKYAVPYCSELEQRIENYCLLGWLLKVGLKCISTEISGSMIPGYLLGTLLRSNLVCYKLHILRKETINNGLSDR